MREDYENVSVDRNIGLKESIPRCYNFSYIIVYRSEEYVKIRGKKTGASFLKVVSYIAFVNYYSLIEFRKMSIALRE